MTMTDTDLMIAFAAKRKIAHGALGEVARSVKAFADAHPDTPVLVLNAHNGRPIDWDLRGSVDEVLARLQPRATENPRLPGRPKLGVVSREITLLPRHWEWLNAQPGGASVTLRKLVDSARHQLAGRDRQRQAQEATYRFMLELAGDEQGYEEATRALYQADEQRFARCIENWPADVREHAALLAAGAFAEAAAGAA